MVELEVAALNKSQITVLSLLSTHSHINKHVHTHSQTSFTLETIVDYDSCIILLDAIIKDGMFLIVWLGWERAFDAQW